jgi:peptide/nickel transport system permease protein
MDLAFMLGGAIITEKIFGIPGIGRLAIRSVVDMDLPIIVGTTLVAATIIVLANLVVDVLYAVIDPRVRV